MRPLLMVPVLCLAMAVVADAAPKKLIPPPMGEDISVRVMRGGSVEISLKAYEGRGNPLAYEIGRQPSHGQLESFQQAENNRQGFASVVYVHDDGEKSIKDEFTFRARMLAGGGLSSPIKVKVMIVDAPGRLGIPTVVDFSAVAGETDRQEIILTNEGGGLLEGRISPKEPFDVEGDGRFSLGRGQSTVLAVRFSPQSTAQVAPQKLSPSPSDPGAAITLKAEAKKPFSATAGTVVIGADGSRAGTITVTNLSSARLELEITTEPENAADVPRSTNIAKGASAGIPVTIAADKKGGALDLGVQISNPFYEEEIEVPVPAVPPKLEVATPELDFRKNKEAELRVTNSGGVVGRFSLELPKGWPTPEGAESFSVAPGSEKAVLLRRPEKAKATSDDKLFVDFGQDRKFPVHLALPASTPPPMTLPASTPPPPPPPAMPWRLNKEVKVESGPGKPLSIAWVAAKAGWTDAVLEVVDATGAKPYKPEPEEKGWWDALKARWTGWVQQVWGRQKSAFDKRLVVPGEEEETEATPAKKDENWQSAEISAQDAANTKVRWRIAARNTRTGKRENVSEEFVIPRPSSEPESARLVPFAPSDSATGPETTVYQAPSKFRPIFRKTRPEFRPQIVRTKHSAEILLYFQQNPAVTGYRLEKRSHIHAINLSNGQTLRDEYETIPLADEKVSAEFSPVEIQGKQLWQVHAKVEGLRPGTVGYWRVVPLAGEDSLPPTDEIILDTLPPWTFPWRGFFLSLITAILAFVLWLRWKSNRASAS